MKKVFLGGTCNNSKWREKLIKLLKINYFNPVVDDWNEESYKEELKQRKECDYLLYTLTPKLKGVYSIAELTQDAITKPDTTVCCILYTEDGDKFDNDQKKSLDAVAKLIEKTGTKVFYNLKDVADFLNKL